MNSTFDAIRIYKQAQAFGIKFDTQVQIENYIIISELYIQSFQLN